MKKYLWSNEQESSMSDELMTFMAGSDIKLDRHLFVFDIQATQAHVLGLKTIQVLNQDEYQSLYDKLAELKQLYKKGEFKLDSSFEDGHSAIEFYLTEHLGDLGKKCHTGRSRNDQVLTCTRLFMKHYLLDIKKLIQKISKETIKLAKQHKKTLIPGYTHLQRAMPNTVAVWLLGFAEAMIEDSFLIDSTIAYINSSPLGTAAGFGVPLDLPRGEIAKELGFDRVQINPVYAQNSRGKFELVVLQNLYQVMLNLRRFSWDLSLFMTSEFDFIKLDKSHTTGSSIMPNKANPDVVELMRASISQIEGSMAQIQSILSLPSGYQRDLQMTKEPIIKGVLMTRQVLSLVPDLIKALKFNKNKMAQAISPEMMATDQALEQAKKGISFREAYGNAKKKSTNITADDSIKNRVSLGGAENLGINLIENRLTDLKSFL